MASVFTRIINGEIPCYKIDENDQFIAFLDTTPLAKGHTLVVPKVEVDYVFDLEDSILADMMVFAKRVARKIEAKIPCKRIGVAVIGLEVPHTHIHLLPLNTVSDINFEKSKLTLTNDELLDIANTINA